MCSGKGKRNVRRRGLSRSFNEARAVCSGKGSWTDGSTSIPQTGFNEARAVCSGKAARSPTLSYSTPCFNEARAVCSGKARHRRL